MGRGRKGSGKWCKHCSTHRDGRGFDAHYEACKRKHTDIAQARHSNIRVRSKKQNVQSNLRLSTDYIELPLLLMPTAIAFSANKSFFANDGHF
jgi:hypothetical protein